MDKCFKMIRKEKEKARAVDITSNIQMERTPLKLFRSVSEDHMIAKCPKPPKDNGKWRKQVNLNEKGNRTCDNGKTTKTKRYMHLWHKCLAMTNVQMKSMVTVRN